MKPSCLSVIAMLAITLLTACASTSPSSSNLGGVNDTHVVHTSKHLGMSVLKTAVNQYCLSEIKNNTYYQTASLVLSKQQQNQVASSVCHCVTEQAPQHITVADATHAALDANYRSKLVTRVVLKSLQTCAINFVKR